MDLKYTRIQIYLSIVLDIIAYLLLWQFIMMLVINNKLIHDYIATIS